MLILASESPRRRELLSRLQVPFECVPAGVAELSEGRDPAALPRRNALLKAGTVAARFPGAWVVGADTGILAGGKLLGKPASEAEGAAMLAMLQGSSHEVITGVAVICRERQFRKSWSVRTQVTFAPLTKGQIVRYMKQVCVLDKAGAYAIQEHPELLGARWRGELENIIGLPLVKLSAVLTACGVIPSQGGRN